MNAASARNRLAVIQGVRNLDGDADDDGLWRN